MGTKDSMVLFTTRQLTGTLSRLRRGRGRGVVGDRTHVHMLFQARWAGWATRITFRPDNNVLKYNTYFLTYNIDEF